MCVLLIDFKVDLHEELIDEVNTYDVVRNAQENCSPDQLNINNSRRDEVTMIIGKPIRRSREQRRCLSLLLREDDAKRRRI